MGRINEERYETPSSPVLSQPSSKPTSFICEKMDGSIMANLHRTKIYRQVFGDNSDTRANISRRASEGYLRGKYDHSRYTRGNMFHRRSEGYLQRSYRQHQSIPPRSDNSANPTRRAIHNSISTHTGAVKPWSPHDRRNNSHQASARATRDLDCKPAVLRGFSTAIVHPLNTSSSLPDCSSPSDYIRGCGSPHQSNQKFQNQTKSLEGSSRIPYSMRESPANSQENFRADGWSKTKKRRKQAHEHQD